MAFKHIDVKPLTGALGAEIFGPDLRKPIPKAEMTEIVRTAIDSLNERQRMRCANQGILRWRTIVHSIFSH